MTDVGKLGRDEGKDRGPEPGDGDSGVGGMVAGGGDIEGGPGDVLPDRRGQGATEKPAEARRPREGGTEPAGG